MHPITALPSRSRLLQEDAFPLETFFTLAEEARPRSNGQRSPVGEAGGRGRERGHDLSPSSAKILPRVLVPPVEHPDGKRAARGGGARKGCRQVLIGVYIIFGWVRTVSRCSTAAAAICPGAKLAAARYLRLTRPRRGTHCSPRRITTDFLRLGGCGLVATIFAY